MQLDISEVHAGLLQEVAGEAGLSVEQLHRAIMDGWAARAIAEKEYEARLERWGVTHADYPIQ